MSWKFSPDRPVYVQVAERMRNLIISGQYPPGGQIPSVRQIALDAAVNPNTVQRSVAELESEGLIVSRGTVGNFVTDDEGTISLCKKSRAGALVDEFIKSAAELSISKEELIQLIKEETDERS